MAPPTAYHVIFCFCPLALFTSNCLRPAVSHPWTKYAIVYAVISSPLYISLHLSLFVIEGTTEEVTDALFANSSRWPHFLAGIVSHGVYKNGPFSVVHAGMGNITLGAVQPSHETETASAGTGFAVGPSKYLLHCLSAAPVLSASIVLPAKLLQIQLEKLAINAIINPLTVIFDRLNGEIFTRAPPSAR